MNCFSRTICNPIIKQNLDCDLKKFNRTILSLQKLCFFRNFFTNIRKLQKIISGLLYFMRK